MEELQINIIAKNILFKNYWEYRNIKEHILEIPQDIKQQIDERLRTNVKDYEGDFIPYYTFNNLIGIHKRIMNEDEDGVVFIVSPPGYGKSTQALIFSTFIDPTFNKTKIIFNLIELKAFLTLASQELKKETEARSKGDFDYKSKYKGKSIILDEGVFMLFSGDAMTREGKIVQKLFSVIRALNILMFVCVTNFRKVNKGVKEDRIIGLIKIERKGIISFRSKKKIRKVRINEHHIFWSKPNYTEKTGKLNRNGKLWTDYSQRKAEFLLEAVE